MKKFLLFCLIIVSILACSMKASADTDFGIGGRGGISIYGDPRGSGPMFGGHLRIRVSPKLDLEILGEFFSTSFEKDGRDVSWKNRYVGTSAKYRFPLRASPVTPYLGAGMCLHHLSRDCPFCTPEEETSSEGCFHSLGGFTVDLSHLPIEFFVEGRYMAVNERDESINFPSFFGGVTYRLP